MTARSAASLQGQIMAVVQHESAQFLVTPPNPAPSLPTPWHEHGVEAQTRIKRRAGQQWLERLRPVDPAAGWLRIWRGSCSRPTRCRWWEQRGGRPTGLQKKLRRWPVIVPVCGCTCCPWGGVYTPRARNTTPPAITWLRSCWTQAPAGNWREQPVHLEFQRLKPLTGPWLTTNCTTTPCCCKPACNVLPRNAFNCCEMVSR